MLDELRTAIAEASFNDDTKARMQPCIVQLAEAFDNCGPISGLIVIAASTPKGAVIFAADAWPSPEIPGIPEAAYNRGAVALALHEATESAESGVVIDSIAVLLGPEGVRNMGNDWRGIAERGLQPVIVVLSERVESVVSVVITVVGIDNSSRRQRVLH